MIFNFGQKVWKAFKCESPKRVITVTVITVVKNTAENVDRHVTDVVPKLFSTRTLSAFRCCGFLVISSIWMCGPDCWPVSESGTEDILAPDSPSESPRTWWFFVAGKDSSRLRFSSKYPTPWWIVRKDRIVGVSWRWFSGPPCYVIFMNA